MFSPTENSHFRKYLTTLGVSIIVAAIAASGFLFRGQADLLIDQKKLGELTPTARYAIERRQEIILFATSWSPLVVSIICLVGLIISAAGITGWAKRQKIVDKREDLEADKTRAEIRALTKEEAERKADEDVHIALGEVSEPPVKEILDTDSASFKEETSVTETANEDFQITTRPRAIRVRSVIQEIESELVEKLLQAYPHAAIQPSIAITTGDIGRYEADALVSIPNSEKDLLFEIKYASGRSGVRHAVEVAATRAISAAKSLDGYNKGKMVFPVIVMVTDDDAGFTHKHVTNALRYIQPALSIKPLLLHFTRTQFRRLDPKRLRFTVDSNIGR